MANKRIGKWKSFEIDISDSTTVSDECDLGGCFDYMLLEAPEITQGKLTVQVVRATGGTAMNFHVTSLADGTDNKVISDDTTGTFIWCVPIHGAQYIKIVAENAQGRDRTFYARGIDRYLTWN